jgi:hypothetical protein
VARLYPGQALPTAVATSKPPGARRAIQGGGNWRRVTIRAIAPSTRKKGPGAGARGCRRGPTTPAHLQASDSARTLKSHP